MSPSTSTRGEVATTGVPLHVCNTIVICGTDLLDPTTPLCHLPFPPIFTVNVKIPEF